MSNSLIDDVLVSELNSLDHDWDNSTYFIDSTLADTPSPTDSAHSQSTSSSSSSSSSSSGSSSTNSISPKSDLSSPMTTPQDDLNSPQDHIMEYFLETEEKKGEREQQQPQHPKKDQSDLCLVDSGSSCPTPERALSERSAPAQIHVPITISHSEQPIIAEQSGTAQQITSPKRNADPANPMSQKTKKQKINEASGQSAITSTCSVTPSPFDMAPLPFTMTYINGTLVPVIQVSREQMAILSAQQQQQQQQQQQGNSSFIVNEPLPKPKVGKLYKKDVNRISGNVTPVPSLSVPISGTNPPTPSITENSTAKTRKPGKTNKQNRPFYSLCPPIKPLLAPNLNQPTALLAITPTPNPNVPITTPPLASLLLVL